MNWKEFGRQYGEGPDEHFEDPAEYWDSVGDRHRAKAIRARRMKIEAGETDADKA